MKYFKMKIRPYLSMVVVDTTMGIIWLISLQWTFANVMTTWLHVLLDLVMALIFLATGIVRYRALFYRNSIDDVTKGKNKKEFVWIAKNLLATKESYIMVYVNIDGFKVINDMYGNDIGDTVLMQVQQVIDNELRYDEVSGRLMADNFGIMMRFHSIQKLDERLSRICRQVGDLSDSAGNSYGIRLSFGVCDSEAGDYTLETMIECANLALSNAVKNIHLVTMGVYDQKTRTQLKRERELEMKMQKALDNKEFIPYLQPKYELKNETVAGAEALVRWNDPKEGIIFPNDFIPLFEKNGFIVQLDLYMFDEVCKLIDRWESAGCHIIPISVNMSREHFAIPNFFDEYKAILKKYDVPKGTIEFELTESLLYNNLEKVNYLVEEIHKLGFYCSIDDFGSGYSSLNMLKDVRVDVLKLDRVFFDEGNDSKRSQDIVRSVLGLAQALQLKTVSEGIEFQNQVDFLKEMNCDYVQGYIFAKPMKVESFERLVYFDEAIRV